jgi:hypothetical protein
MTKVYGVIVGSTMEDEFSYSVQADDEVSAARIAHEMWTRDATLTRKAGVAVDYRFREIERAYQVHDIDGNEVFIVDRIEVVPDSEGDFEYEQKADDVANANGTTNNATLLAEDIVKRIDGPLFRRQRSLIYALETVLAGKLSAVQLEDLSGISNLLEVIADTAHDVYGLATLMQADDDLYQGSDFPDLLDRK